MSDVANVTLPSLFRIDMKEDGNSIRQMAIPAWTGSAGVAVFKKGRLTGYSITPTDSSSPVFVLTTSAKPIEDWTHAIRLQNAAFDPTSASSCDLSSGKWIKHPQQSPPFMDLTQYEQHATAVCDSWIDGFSYKREDVQRNVDGLRPPQMGAIYSVQGHWTVSSEPATVVLPTGVGKTETMLSLLVAERCKRLLVVVPTDALRTQIADKFLTLGLLKAPQFQVVSEKAQYPVVGILNRRPADTGQVDSLFRKCNVIVTTMALAGQCSPDVMRRMAELCSCLFIDEAHHVAAPKWKEFKETFANSRIVQFTATPFRNDDKPIGGKRIFTFSLRQAQEQGYFKKINFKPVTEFDPSQKDTAIAEAAVEQLRAEAHLGHILMARVANVKRAAEVFECYRGYSEFNPVQIHTGITSKVERDEIRQQLLTGKARIVVCVDMLGEGFDLPELKIAAFHDIRKTLAVTLQLAGRFTRTKPHLGNATFVANVADLEVKDELKRLYQHDSDWNSVLPLLSDDVNKGDFSLGEFLGGFKELPDEITLRNVKPAMSTVVYRTKCAMWEPDRFHEGLPGYKSFDRFYHTLNPHENTLVVVTTRRVPVPWAQIDEIYNWDWQLYVLHWDQPRGLLFIHNSSNSGYFKRLAEVVGGEVEQFRGPLVFRGLAGVNRLKLQNVGLLEQLGRLIRYTMRAGSDVESGISEAQKQKAIKANLFGQGFENGQKATIGCSYKGRFWSYKTTNLLEWTKWCNALGEKLTNASLDPEEVLRGTLVPELISERPQKLPIAVDWPDIFHKEPEQAFAFDIGGTTVFRHEADLTLVNPAESGPLIFAITSGSATVSFETKLFERGGSPDYSIQPLDPLKTNLLHRGKVTPVQEFFEEEPPTFWFSDGSELSGIEYVAPRKRPEPFPRARIEEWDWAGTNIRIESQGTNRNPAAIQYRVIAEMKKKGIPVIVDDDDQGESADVVGIREEKDHIAVEFWHCKFAMEDQPGYRIKELFELCGQAQKSIRWLEKPRDLFTHLLRREPRRFKGKEYTRYEAGTQMDLLRIRQKADSQRVYLKVFIVQPGLSKKSASKQQLELLAVTENYLLETFAVPFGVVASS